MLTMPVRREIVFEKDGRPSVASTSGMASIEMSHFATGSSQLGRFSLGPDAVLAKHRERKLRSGLFASRRTQEGANQHNRESRHMTAQLLAFNQRRLKQALLGVAVGLLLGMLMVLNLHEHREDQHRVPSDDDISDNETHQDNMCEAISCADGWVPMLPAPISCNAVPCTLKECCAAGALPNSVAGNRWRTIWY